MQECGPGDEWSRKRRRFGGPRPMHSLGLERGLLQKPWWGPQHCLALEGCSRLRAEAIVRSIEDFRSCTLRFRVLEID